MPDSGLPKAGLDALHYEDYAPHVNSKFTVRFDETVVEMELIEAEEKLSAPRQERFLLVFRSPADAPAHQGMYEVHHDQLGNGALFLVPTGKDKDSIFYEAVFNRRRPAQQ